MEKRAQFSSRTATVLTMIGVAVGLGNVWRFPYMMGSHGGSAFLFVYLAFVVLFGLPAVMAEWSLGRATRSGPIGAFATAFGKRFGLTIGVVLTVSVLIANSYYLVVVAMVSYSAWFSAVNGFAADNLESFAADGLANGWLMSAVAIAILGLALTTLVVGLRNGIERVSKICVPFFGLIVAYLIFNTFALPGAGEKFVAFLRPDFSAMNATNVFAAMGQAIFSLSLGGTFFVIYGSYLRPDEKIPITALWTGLGDAGAALLASLFLIPSMLVFGIDLAQGPGLIFDTLPRLFMSMPGGRIVGTLFLAALALMAFLSSVAALQVGFGGLKDYFALKTWQVVALIGAMQCVLIVFTSFRQDLIQPMDLIFGSGMQCLGCLLACLALVWGLGRWRALSEIFGKDKVPQAITRFFMFWIQWVVPIALLIVLIVATDIGKVLLDWFR